MRSRSVLALAATLLVSVSPLLAASVATTFTYQGQLTDGGTPADGNYAMKFRLCSNGTCNGGGQLQEISIASVTVTEGLFTVNLGFDTSHFVGEQRWLEIAVAGTTLCPRQELTATPFATYAMKPWITSGANLYYTAGNVGIGDSTPIAPLTVGSGDKFYVEGDGDVFFTDDNSSITFPAATDRNAPMIYMFASGTTNDARMVLAHSPSYGGWGLRYRDVGDQFEFLGNSENVMTIELGSKQVGIGTEDPEISLHIAAGTDLELNGGGFLQTGATASTNIVMDNNEIQCRNNGAGETLYLNYEGGDIVLAGTRQGNVGIGTSSPGSPLTVYTEDSGTAVQAFTNKARVASFAQYASEATSNAVYIYTASDFAPALSIAGDGPNGVLLDVGGTARVQVLEVTGADLAERFPASEELKPGMVVAIDTVNAGQLCLARGAYNRCVAGIISGANGLAAGTVMGNLPESKDGPPLALSGRVWVYADATSAAINPGDLLTSAEEPGYAMKAVDLNRAQGATLGKAMTALKQGEKGLVLVLVNLH